MDTRNDRTLWITGAVAAVAIVALIVTLAVTWGGKDKQDEEAVDSGVADSEDGGARASIPEGEDKPGAMIGNDQRQWPGFGTGLDDTPHKEPGTYSVDHRFQRPVWTPVNHDGDLPAKDDLAEGMDSCKDPESIELDGKTQQQYVNARYLAVNDQAGPTTMRDGVPGGYAHTPQGAVLATMNMTSYGMYGESDEIGLANEKALWSTSQQARDEREFSGTPDKTGQEIARAMMLPSANGFDVLQCSPDVVVVEVLYAAQEGDPEGHVVLRVPMIWRDGDWRADLSGRADQQLARDTTSQEGFTEVVYE